LLYGAFAIHYSLALLGALAAPLAQDAVRRSDPARARFLDSLFPHDHVLQTRVADTFYGARLRLLLDVLLLISSSPIRCAAGFSSRCW
jgi:hypothetical protein